jgi:hypothetical protein
MSNDGMGANEEKIPPIMLAEGFERAFLGIAEDFAGHPRAVYDYGKCLRILMIEKSMSQDEAIETMDFKVVGAFVGEATPIFVQRMSYKNLRIVRQEL